MKRALIFLTVLSFAAAAFGNGVSLNSPGTRAISMGGAYISHVSDYSAPYWNPAGLMNIEGMQASIFITDIIPLAAYKSAFYGVDAKAEVNHILAPNAAFLWTCKMHDKLRLGVSVIVPAGLGVEWKGDELKTLTGGEAMNWKSSIAVMNFSLSAAMKFGDKLNVGAAFHLVNGSMTMEKGIVLPTPVGPAQYEEESSGWGFGAGIGVQYMLNEQFTLGLALRTPMKVPFSGDAKVTSNTLGILSDYDFDRDITWPLWAGGGVTFRPSEKWMVAAEAQWSQWSETQDYLIAEHDTQKDSIYLLWDDAVQIRFGGEYMLNEKVALRAGAYIDPAPGPAETQTILLPNTNFTGLCAGAGYKMNKWSFDFGFEYILGEERQVAPYPTNDPINMRGKHNLDILVFSGAVTYKFK